MQTELRKHQHTLIVYGTGTILFGLWSMAKSAVLLILDDSENSIANIIAAMYIYLGDGLEFVAGVVESIRGGFDSIDNVLTLLVDITSFVTVGEMVFAAIMVGKLTNEISQRGKAPAEVGK